MSSSIILLFPHSIIKKTYIDKAIGCKDLYSIVVSQANSKYIFFVIQK